MIMLYDKIYKISHYPLAKQSTRIIHHWKKNGLIDSNFNEYKQQRYSVKEILWIYCIKELRFFGIGFKEIKLIKDEFFKKVDLEDLIELYKYYIIIENINSEIKPQIIYDKKSFTNIIHKGNIILIVPINKLFYKLTLNKK